MRPNQEQIESLLGNSDRGFTYGAGGRGPSSPILRGEGDVALFGPYYEGAPTCPEAETRFVYGSRGVPQGRQNVVLTLLTQMGEAVTEIRMSADLIQKRSGQPTALVVSDGLLQGWICAPQATGLWAARRPFNVTNLPIIRQIDGGMQSRDPEVEIDFFKRYLPPELWKPWLERI